MRQVAIEMSMRLNCALRRDEALDIFVARCPALGLFSQGLTSDEAKEAIEEAILLFVKHSFSRGVLEEVLAKRGFAPVPEAAMATIGNEAESIQLKAHEFDDEFPVTVPLHLLMAAQSVAACQP